jgi:hypothetical protein
MSSEGETDMTAFEIRQALETIIREAREAGEIAPRRATAILDAAREVSDEAWLALADAVRRD